MIYVSHLFNNDKGKSYDITICKVDVQIFARIPDCFG